MDQNDLSMFIADMLKAPNNIASTYVHTPRDQRTPISTHRSSTESNISELYCCNSREEVTRIVSPYKTN